MAKKTKKVNELALLWDWGISQNIIFGHNIWDELGKQDADKKNWFCILASLSVDKMSERFQKEINLLISNKVKKKIKNYHDAEDCVNELLLDSYNAIGKYSPSEGKRLKNWINLIVGRKLNGFLRKFYTRASDIKLIGLDYTNVEKKNIYKPDLLKKSNFYRGLDARFYEEIKNFIILANVLRAYNICSGLIEFYESDIILKLTPLQKRIWKHGKTGLSQRKIAKKIHRSLGCVNKNIKAIRQVVHKIIKIVNT